MAWGAGQFKCLLQVIEDGYSGVVIDVGQQGEDAICRAHSAGEAKHMWVAGPYVPL